MRSLVLVRHGDPHRAFELREFPDPLPAADEVLIDTEYSGINFADVLARLGLYPDAPPMPCVLGYEVVGRIRELGVAVAGRRPDLKPGTRVLALTRFGGYSSVAVAKAMAVHPIPEDADGAEATALATQGITAFIAAEDCVRLYPGDRVLIHAAAGGVGLMLVQLAKRRGCEIFATAGSEEKLELLRDEFGVQHAINYRTQDFVSEIQRITGKKQPIHVAFDSLGGEVFARTRALLAPGGKLVYFGVAEMTGRGWLKSLRAAWSALRFGFIHPLSLLESSRALIGLNVLRWADEQPDKLAILFAEMQKLVQSGELIPHVGGTFPIREVGQAHELLESRQSAGKIALRWS